MFDVEDAGILLDDVGENSPGCCSIDLNFDIGKFTINEDVFFTGVFAYTLSRFMGSEKVLFHIVDENMDILPLFVGCENQDVSSFMYGIIEAINRCEMNRCTAASNITFNCQADEIDLGDFNAHVIKRDNNNYTLNIKHSQKYSDATVKRFLASYELIANQILDVNELKDINYTASSDLNLLDSYNRTQHSLRYRDVLDAFRDNLLENPENDLVSFKDKVYSYGQGAFIADKIAKRLADLGVEKQDCVAFLTERSELCLLNVLAIQSMGAIYVPLDNGLPDERVEFILDDTDSKVLIVTDRTFQRAGQLSGDAVLLNISDMFHEEIETLDDLDIEYGKVACVLYTSGTTGVPKGVNVTRKSIVNVCEWYADTYGFGQGDVYGMYASIGFDVASYNINLAMYAGACLAVVPGEYKSDMLQLNDYFIRQGVTHAWITTQVGKLFMQSVDATSLDFLMVGGEKLGVIENPKDFTLIDVCGPTEAFEHICSIRYVEKIDTSSIGHLNYNTKMYVLDEESRRVPIGAVGELYLSGYQIADGYLNREDKTQEAFLINPFDEDEEYSVLYRTGDVVRILPDGSIGIVGRRDSQVKIRGNRVELSEVESVIRELNYIEDVTVQTMKNGDNYELVAYVVPTMEVANLDDLICRYIALSKPDYMVPSYIVELESIPVNINGKVDKKSLPKVDLTSLHEDYVAPTTDNEKIVVEAFEEIFNQEKIGIYDDFVRMGGDSISAIRLLAILQKNGLSCSARDIINYQTPFSIAQNAGEVNRISYENIEGEVDLLPIQSFFFDQVNANEYSQEYILKANTVLDRDILQRAFDEVSKTHDMLRATYRRDNDRIIQEILSVNTQVCKIKEINLKTDDFNTEIGRILLKSNNNLDIGDNLIEINLIQYEGSSYVIFVIHHLIIDGVSWSILIDDLTYFYTLFMENREGELPKSYPYKYWVEDARKLASNITDEEKRHWIEVNSSMDDSLIKGPSHLFAFNVDAKFRPDNLLMLSEEEFLALSIARAYKKTYGEDIIFNKESYGRDESIADVNRTIGWFTSQFPVPVEVTNGYDNISLVRDVYALKIAFKDVKNLGMNYGSLIYDSHELEFKHCPVTLNFLSDEFVFRNEIFESLEDYLSSNDRVDLRRFESTAYGITLKISRMDDAYIVSGNYAEDTYLCDRFDEFIENIRYEFDFIGNYRLEDENIVCGLSESQMGVYLDEKVRDMGTAYSTRGTFECPDKSVEDIRNAIETLIEKHPVLKGRVLDGDIPLLVCDSYPLIELTQTDDVSELIMPFDLDECLARFYIMEGEGEKSIFFDIHHIISDGTNCHLIREELNSIFEGRFDDACDLGFVYSSNFFFDAKYKNIYEEAHEFYRANLSDIDEVNSLLYDGRSDNNRIMLPIRGIKNRVKKFSHEKGITVGNLFNAVFAYTYSRFTGSSKVFYTYTQHGRHEPYAQKALGMYARTVPVIADCSDASIDEYLTNVSDLILDSMKYSVYPYRLLAREFDLTLNGAFEYNYDLNDLSDVGDELIIKDMEIDLISDFVCVVNDLNDGYSIRIDSCDRYSNELVIRFLNVFRQVLIQMLEKDRLSQIGYVSGDDLKLLDTYNQTQHHLPYSDILDAFNDSLDKFPDNLLVSYEDRSYTYGEGAFIVSKIAQKLSNYGVRKGDAVAFLTERCEQYLFDPLAIMSLGAVYVPLDDKHPDDRLQFILEDTSSKVLIVSDETQERAGKLHYDGIVLNVSDIVGQRGTSDKLDVQYNDLACILYTSGTTGIPKGVKTTRKAVMNITYYHSNYYDFTDDDIYSLFSSIGFDVAIKCMFTPLCKGGSLDIIPDDARLDMDRLNEHLTAHGVTFANIPTQVAKLFITRTENTTLKYLFTGGEKLGEVDVDFSYHLVDSYGPTEACVDVSCIDLAEKTDFSSVGHLIYNTKAYVLDSEKRRVAIGAVGELCVAGYQIADGYLNREEQTARAFIENPFDDDENYSVLYRTGDLVRVLQDGSIAIVGRSDNQVKIRGNRVELLEVERVIREIPYVTNATVQTVKNQSNHEIVAYVVTSGQIDNLEEEVCDYVARLKPDYMIPSFVIQLDEIPLNVNGKVDKRALPEVDLTDLHADYAAPTNDNERAVVKAFEKVFDHSGIGINDDFVRMGGDSISAIRLISALQKEGITSSARDILNYKTPYLIAQNIGEAEEVSYDAVEGECGLHPIQSFFADEIAKNEYSQEFILKSKISLNRDTLQKAFDELSNIHDMLRATYHYEGGNLVQDILPLNTRTCEIREVFTDDDFNNSMGRIILDSNRALDISGNLIEITLVRHENECYLVFVIHHLIIDGVSWSILIDDLTQIYNSIENDEKTDVKRPYPYSLWVEDINKLVSGISEAEKNHWIEVDRMWDDCLIRGKSKVFALNIEGNFSVDNQLNLTEEEYLGLAIARAYKKTYGEDIIFNRESHGRDETIADVSRTIGWFTSQFPVPVGVSAKHDDISLVRDVCSLKNAFKNLKHLGLNYGSLVYITGDLKYKHCPVTFNFLSLEFTFKNEIFQSLEGYLENNDGIKLENFESTSYGISLNVSRLNNKYYINGDYAQDTYLAESFDEFIENMETELKFIGQYEMDEIVCPLSESQLGLYLDEKVNDMGTAYSASGLFRCPADRSVSQIRDAIDALILKHPILKGRIVDGEIPLISCDSYPSIEIVSTHDCSSLLRSFNLSKSLARFFIVENGDGKSIFYDIHHIINDATTSSLIADELSEFFEGDFSDDVDVGFAIESFNSFESKFDPAYEQGYEFYRRSLSDIDEVGILLGDGNGTDNIIKLPIRGIREHVEEFCHRIGITVGNFLNGVFAYTYSRFAGSDKVYYTTTQHGRHEGYAKKAFGMFVRTIPVIADCENSSVRDYLRQVSDLILDSMRFSDYPYRLLAAEFGLNLDIAFEYNFDLNDVSDVGDELVSEDMGIDLICDFACFVNDLDDGFLVSVESSADYSSEFIKRFLNVFEEVLVQMMDVENLEDIDYVSKSDLELLDGYNQTQHDLEYADLLDAFNDNLLKYKYSNLVTFKDRAYTYCEGAYLADRIAKELKKLDVNPQDPVAYLVERSELYLLNSLAVMSVGAVYVPLDSKLPDERLSFMIRDTGANVVIASDETYERAKNITDKAILNVSDIVNGETGELSELDVRYGSIACILYTSGTTGIPKGVKITRKSILNISAVYHDRYGLGNGDVYGMFSTIGFDAALLAMVAVMYSGACLSIVPEDIRLNINALNDYFIQQGITHTLITSQVGRLFMKNIKDTSIEVLLVGGEKLGEFESPDNYLLVDAFGPTEACVFISSIVNSQKIDPSSVGHLGYNTKAYILDDELRRVPIGAVGELYIAGSQISSGYLNRDDETAKAFIANPFSDDRNYRVMYRSGDMVRVLSDGSIAIVGRRDSQVKIRGNRVELSAIEKVIREIDYVDDVSVQTIKNGRNNMIVAYVVSDSEDIEEDLCSYVAAKKPDYMVPSFVVELDEIPLNVNGKVDRKALPDVDLSSLHVEYVAPETDYEKAIAEAFEEVFNRKIGLNDDFITLGGDSLTAIKLMSALNSRGIYVDLKAIFTSRTPYNIAKHLEVADGFVLERKGDSGQNMFLIPPISGLSKVFSTMIEKIEFNGNIYTIDDLKYRLSLDELRNKQSGEGLLDVYYNAIKGLFNDGDILLGYSLGCVFASLLAERLEGAGRNIGKCIFIDSDLEFTRNDDASQIDAFEEFIGNPDDFDDEFVEKYLEIFRINYKLNFHLPKIKAHVTFLTNSDGLKDNLKRISKDHDYILIDSTHKRIIKEDIGRILKYFFKKRKG